MSPVYRIDDVLKTEIPLSQRMYGFLAVLPTNNSLGQFVWLNYINITNKEGRTTRSAMWEASCVAKEKKDRKFGTSGNY